MQLEQGALQVRFLLSHRSWKIINREIKASCFDLHLSLHNKQYREIHCIIYPLPPMVTSYKTIIHYHSRDIDIDQGKMPRCCAFTGHWFMSWLCFARVIGKIELRYLPGGEISILMIFKLSLGNQ